MKTGDVSRLELELEMASDSPMNGEAASVEEGLEEVGDEDGAELEEDDAQYQAHEGDDDAEYEDDEDAELIEPDARGYGERFYELSLREFESPDDRDEEVQRVLREMEREYFLGGLVKKLKRAGSTLVKTGLKVASKHIPGVNVVAQLAGGNLRGALGALANTALSALSSHPAIAAALPVLKSLGFDPAAGPHKQQDAWAAFAGMAKDAFGQLAHQLPPGVGDPLAASREASRAFEVAVRNVRARGRGAGVSTGRRVIHLRRGQQLIIKVR
jgi:hypothetical protein